LDSYFQSDSIPAQQSQGMLMHEMSIASLWNWLVKESVCTLESVYDIHVFLQFNQ
jgi:hypothetical protein